MATIHLNTPEAEILQTAIQQKLAQHGYSEEDDPVMSEYCIVMLANHKPPDLITQELQDLIGENYDISFTKWLFKEVENVFGSYSKNSTTNGGGGSRAVDNRDQPGERRSSERPGSGSGGPRGSRETFGDRSGGFQREGGRGDSDEPSGEIKQIETVEDSRERPSNRGGRYGGRQPPPPRGVFNNAVSGLHHRDRPFSQGVKRDPDESLQREAPPHRRPRLDNGSGSGLDGIPTGPRSMLGVGGLGVNGSPSLPHVDGGGENVVSRDRDARDRRDDGSRGGPSRRNANGASIFERVGARANGRGGSGEGGVPNGQHPNQMMRAQGFDGENMQPPNAPPQTNGPHQMQFPPQAKFQFPNGNFFPGSQFMGGFIPQFANQNGAFTGYNPQGPQVLAGGPFNPAASQPQHTPGSSSPLVSAGSPGLPASAASAGSAPAPSPQPQLLPSKPIDSKLCTFGVECKKPTCIYAHPSPAATKESGLVLSSDPCEKGLECDDQDCPKSHVSASQKSYAPAPAASAPATAALQPQIPAPQAQPAGAFFADPAAAIPGAGSKPCKFGAGCTRPGCVFVHPWDTPSYGASGTPCRYGASCTRPDCHFTHPPGHRKPFHYNKSMSFGPGATNSSANQKAPEGSIGPRPDEDKDHVSQRLKRFADVDGDDEAREVIIPGGSGGGDSSKPDEIKKEEGASTPNETLNGVRSTVAAAA